MQQFPFACFGFASLAILHVCVFPALHSLSFNIALNSWLFPYLLILPAVARCLLLLLLHVYRLFVDYCVYCILMQSKCVCRNHFSKLPHACIHTYISTTSFSCLIWIWYNLLAAGQIDT